MNTGNINIKDIARLAGVGVATVSRVINNTGEVKEATQKRVREIIKEYNYVPNNSARNLKRSQSNTVCVLMKGIANPVFNDMLSIIQKIIIILWFSRLTRMKMNWMLLLSR